MAAPARSTELTSIVVQPSQVRVSSSAATAPTKPTAPNTSSTLTSLKPQQPPNKSSCTKNLSIVDVPFFLGESVGGGVTIYGFVTQTAALGYVGVVVAGLFGLSHAALRYYQKRASLNAAAKELEASDQQLQDATKVASDDIKAGESLVNGLAKDEKSTETQIQTLKREQADWKQLETGLNTQIKELQANLKSIQASDQASKDANAKLTSDLASIQGLLNQYQTFLRTFNNQFKSFLEASQKAQAEGRQMEAVDLKLDNSLQLLGTSLDKGAAAVSSELTQARDLRDQFIQFSTTFTASLQAKIKELQIQVQRLQETEGKMKADSDKLGSIVERETKLFADQESLEKQRTQVEEQRQQNLKLLEEAQAALSKLQAESRADTSLKQSSGALASALDSLSQSTQAETAELDKLLKGDDS